MQAVGLWMLIIPSLSTASHLQRVSIARKRLIKNGFHTALEVPDQHRQSSTNKTVFALVQKFARAQEADQ